MANARGSGRSDAVTERPNTDLHCVAGGRVEALGDDEQRRRRQVRRHRAGERTHARETARSKTDGVSLEQGGHNSVAKLAAQTRKLIAIPGMPRGRKAQTHGNDTQTDEPDKARVSNKEVARLVGWRRAIRARTHGRPLADPVHHSRPNTERAKTRRKDTGGQGAMTSRDTAQIIVLRVYRGDGRIVRAHVKAHGQLHERRRAARQRLNLRQIK